MRLKELKDVLRQTELPITVLTNQLRWERYTSDREACEMRLQLADFIVIRADLDDHVSALEHILKICDAVARGRNLEECQRCQECVYACTRADEHCDSFDDRTPHESILSWLDDCCPLRPLVRDWIAAQAELQATLRSGLQRFFPDATPYQIAEDSEGHHVLVEMSPEEQAAYETRKVREHESRAQRCDQYELNVAQMRRLCVDQGDLQEIVHLITEGLPRQVRQPVHLS
jgi:hypothetical protein